MKVKCIICGQKGFHSTESISEFWASRFLMVHMKSFDFKYVCRKCVIAILESLRFESNRIDDLYKPQIKEKEKAKVKIRGKGK